MASSCFVSGSPKGAVPFSHALFCKQVNLGALYIWWREGRQCKTFQCICSQAFAAVDLQMYSILKIRILETNRNVERISYYHQSCSRLQTVSHNSFKIWAVLRTNEICTIKQCITSLISEDPLWVCKCVVNSVNFTTVLFKNVDRCVYLFSICIFDTVNKNVISKHPRTLKKIAFYVSKQELRVGALLNPWTCCQIWV